jgi:hypothetical protein
MSQNRNENCPNPPPPPLITGAVDEAMNSKTLRHHNLRRANPLIKPLISGSLEEFHKSNFENDL